MSLQQEITCDIVLQYTQITRSEQPESIAERLPLAREPSPAWPGATSLSPLRPCSRISLRTTGLHWRHTCG